MGALAAALQEQIKNQDYLAKAITEMLKAASSGTGTNQVVDTKVIGKPDRFSGATKHGRVDRHTAFR